MDTLIDLNQQIKRDFEYVPQSTTLNTTPYELLCNRRGVCQDFANLLICLARLLAIPARYRVGYIRTGVDYSNQLQSEASNAWVECYLPWIGWVGFDPTNGTMVGLDHIRVACGQHVCGRHPDLGDPVSGGRWRIFCAGAHRGGRGLIQCGPNYIEWASRWTLTWLGMAWTMTMGAEPTYLSAQDSGLPEWTVEALGHDKQVLATRLAALLQQRFPRAGVFQEGQGKWYQGEDLPRWALRCVWPLQPQGEETSGVEALLEQLCQRLGLDVGHARPCQNADAWVLVMGFDEERGWRSCPWPQDERSVCWIRPAQVGMRLPWSEVELDLETALCVEPGEKGLQVFLPPVSCTAAWLELVCALPRNACLQGYAPPTTSLVDEGVPGLRLLSVTPNPGVIEVNLHPASSWSELVDIVTGVDQDARACGLVSHHYGQDGTLLGSGGGCHVVVGGASPAQSPFALRPDFLRSILVWWNRHPVSFLSVLGSVCGTHLSGSPRGQRLRHKSPLRIGTGLSRTGLRREAAPGFAGANFSRFAGRCVRQRSSQRDLRGQAL